MKIPVKDYPTNRLWDEKVFSIEHKVLLLNIDQLETLIKRHLNVPIKLSSYQQIFEKAGIADISLIDEDRQKIVEFGQLIKDVMSCLISESEDPITEGFYCETSPAWRREKGIVPPLPPNNGMKLL